jgi:hypothetical protein
MKRMRPPAHERWRAIRTGAGQWHLVDLAGRDPLRSEDPAARLEAVHLAAAAPQLQAALAWLIQDFHQLELRPMHLRHRVRLNYAEVALIESRPPLEEWLRQLAVSQRELDLAA